MQKDIYGGAGLIMSCMKEQYVDMDEDATDLIMQGVSIDIVLQFHEQAPAGYWKEVAERMNSDDNLSLDTVYDELEVVFNYHPDSRELPES